MQFIQYILTNPFSSNIAISYSKTGPSLLNSADLWNIIYLDFSLHFTANHLQPIIYSKFFLRVNFFTKKILFEILTWLDKVLDTLVIHKVILYT